MLRRAVVLAILLVGLFVAGCGSSGADAEADRPAAGSELGERPVLRLGTKDFTEQFVLGEVYAQALRARGFRVEVKPNLGSSELVDRVLTDGGIDLYPEYTGVIVGEIAGEHRRARSAADTYRRAKKFQARRGFEVLARSPGSNRLANAVTPDTARRPGSARWLTLSASGITATAAFPRIGSSSRALGASGRSTGSTSPSCRCAPLLSATRPWTAVTSTSSTSRRPRPSSPTARATGS